MENYDKYYITVDSNRASGSMYERNKKLFISLVNKIVEYGGCVETKNYFDYKYLGNTFEAYLTKDMADKINKTDFVFRVTKV